MANDSGGLSDELQVELNPTGDEPDRGPQPDPIPRRPADDAKLEKWVDYVVKLGAHRKTVTGKTLRWDRETEKKVHVPALSRADLIDLAERLGG